MTNDLHSRLLSAHAARDQRALVTLYSEAANTSNDLNAACFFLTHAYVHALELGDPRAQGLHARLIAEGREE